MLRKFFFVPYVKFLEDEIMKRKDLEQKLSESDSILATANTDAEKIIDQAKLDAKNHGI